MAEIQWNGDNIAEVIMFMHPEAPIYMGKQFSNADEIVGVATPQGLRVAHIGDWITKDDQRRLNIRLNDGDTNE
jgi:hypothetical protein